VLTVALAVGSALCNALASILQRRGARSIPTQESMRLSLALDVLRRPIWLLGLLAMCGGFGFQAAALSSGDLALVQPVLLAELPITLLLAPLFFKVTAGRRDWLAVIGMSAGLALVLFAFSPSSGNESVTLTLTPMLMTVAASCGLAAVLVLLALRLRGSARAATFGTAAGTMFALTAALMKQAMIRLDSGVSALFTSWALYAMAVAGVVALYLWQNALQAGTLVAAQPAITLSDPILATAIGVLLFGERIRLGGWLGLELFGAVLIALASVELARSPLVSGEDSEHPAEAENDPEAEPDRL
jgi:drug/metabolite transporter (DMT)-like permease